MGKEKRLFLLAVMTVMMSTVGYSKDTPIRIEDGREEYNKEEIEVKKPGEVGVIIKNGIFTNEEKGNLIVTNGKGVFLSQDKQVKAELNNAGTITVNGGIGIEFKGGVLNNTGKDKNGLHVSGDGSVGILQSGGNLDNKGLINVIEKGTGIKISKGTLTNTGVKDKDDSGIVASGDKSVGIRLEGTGKVENKDGGIIKGTNQGIGILVSAGTFTNSSVGKVNGVIGIDNGIGIKLEGTGKVENTGKISALGKKGIGVDISSGEFTNKRGATISVGGSGVGVNVSGGKVINEGKITVSGAGTGVNISGGIFTNKNIISGSKGTGVALENGTFINTGEVTITDTDQVAIKSLGGNNTVYLKNGSKVTGKIVGADGVDVLGLGAGTYKNLDVSNYEAIAVRGEDVKIEKSIIGLEYNKGTKSYFDKTNNNMNIFDTPKAAPKEDKEKFKNKEVSGNLTIADTTLAINFKDALTKGEKKGLENPIINVGKDGTLTFEKGITLVLDSSDGSKKFDIYKALGFGKDKNGEDKNGKLILGLNGNIEEVFNKTAVWNYYKDSNGHLIAEKESYNNVVLKSQLKDFANLLDEQEIGNKGLGAAITSLETLKTQEAFTKAITQMSGGVHGYIVDFAALNARTMTNTMRNRALTRDYMRKRPLNSWTQDVSYIDNNHRLGGLMNVDYTEKGVLGVSEKQILPNGRLGLVYGGSKGNAKFEGGQNGSSTLDGAYFGGYYNHEFNNKWSLNSNANFVYTHNKVTRNIDLEYGKEENTVKNPIFKSTYPTYTVGMGTSLIYTVKDDLRNKAHFYAGVDVERIMAGNINENRDQKDDNTGLAIKRDEKHGNTYYSIVPSAGIMVQNTGYVFDRKYRIGADLNWETEVGNIKDGKRIKLTGLDKEYKIKTSERENVFSYSLFGALDLTESLSVNARYTSVFSDEYDADMIGAGFEYKMDTMADNIFGDFAHRLENRRTFSDRWGMTLGLMMETDDADDAVDKDKGTPVIGENITSMEYKPKITLSINDKKSNWSYYFEAYHKTNDLFGSRKGGERESHATRYHGEARWNDTYSKGSYGMSFGYRNEFSEKPYYLTSKGKKEVNKNGTHELRLTPSFTYDLGHGFTLGGKSAIVFMYKYEGDRAGQMDMNTESQIGVSYSGFMPRWDIAMNFYREDTWYDHSNSKYDWNKEKRDYLSVAKKDQVNQLRPSITYYFGNGSNFRFDARIPLGNGKWTNAKNGTKGTENYETRYGFNYTFPVTPEFTATVGGTFLNYKDKTAKGETQRYYAFRPNIGFSYSF